MNNVWAFRILFVVAIAVATFLLMEWLVGGWRW